MKKEDLWGQGMKSYLIPQVKGGTTVITNNLTRALKYLGLEDPSMDIQYVGEASVSDVVYGEGPVLEYGPKKMGFLSIQGAGDLEGIRSRVNAVKWADEILSEIIGKV